MHILRLGKAGHKAYTLPVNDFRTGPRPSTDLYADDDALITCGGSVGGRRLHCGRR